MQKNTSASNWRWWICSLLFAATMVNYMDRQVLSLTWKDFIAPDFGWTNSDYGLITGFFSLAYAGISLFAGKFIDWAGTRRGYLIAIFVWSLGACLHALCGWGAVRTASALMLSVGAVSVWMFMACRFVLALGEAGNFPAAIKVTAEYFPKKDRALATSIFNAGSSIGALLAPACIPWLASRYGWEMSFIIIGAVGFIWMGFWMAMYDHPEESRHVNEAELAYIRQDDNDPNPNLLPREEAIPYWHCFRYRQTWSFIAGKFFTDGVWWFFLFWAPAYFSDQYGLPSDSPTAIALIFTLYAIVTVLSICGGYLPKFLVERRGMEPYSGRMLAMLIFAFFPLTALMAQPLGGISPWFPAVIIGLAGAGHQAWSANLYSTIGDMFPKTAVATITGIGTMAGGIASFLINTGSGLLFDYAAAQGVAFAFAGYHGKEAGYMIVFCLCAVGYILAWSLMKTLVPRYNKIVV